MSVERKRGEGKGMNRAKYLSPLFDFSRRRRENDGGGEEEERRAR